MRRIARNGLALALALLPSSGVVRAESALGRLKVSLWNATTGAPGEAESVTLYKLESGMDPVASLGPFRNEITMKDIQVDATVPYLLQVMSSGVSYNHPLQFPGDGEAEIHMTVYDVTRDRGNLGVKSARYLLRRDGNVLTAEKLYVVENHTRPAKTYYDPKGTFRVQVPEGLIGPVSVYASSASGMPVPQTVSPLPDGAGYVTDTAFKPGTTDITVAYSLDYASGTCELREKTFYPLPRLLALITPPDVKIDGPAWENLTPHPESRFIVLQQRGVAAGETIALNLAGGTLETAATASNGSSGLSGANGASSAPVHGTVTQLPDPARYRMWIIVLLMGAVLAYGLVNAVRAPEERSSDKPAHEA